MTLSWEPDPYDPALDGFCTSCRATFHAACMGWWRWCPCDCGLGGDLDPLRQPRHQNGHKGD